MKQKGKVAVKAPLTKILVNFKHSLENGEASSQEKSPQSTKAVHAEWSKPADKQSKSKRPGFDIAGARRTDFFLDPDEDRPE